MLYKAGDIGRVPPTGLMSRTAAKLMGLIFTPPTIFFHHFVIRSYIPDEDDYEIKEAISSGVRDGRLSWYKEYKIYRLTNPEAVAKGELACAKYSRYGREGYDYLLFLKLLAGVIKVEMVILWREHRSRKIRCAMLPYARDNSFICTEVAYEIAYLMGVALCPVDVVSLPPAIQEAIDGGTLAEVTPEPPTLAK